MFTSKNADKDVETQILFKEEMKETLGRSPNHADTLMMKMVFEFVPERQRAFAVIG